jgi:H+-transporting ATPase
MRFKESCRVTDEARPDLTKVTAAEALAVLRTDVRVGLGDTEVQSRLRESGHNEVPERKTNPALRFIGKFWGLTAWMLEAIIVLSWFLRRYPDLYIVTALLVLNAIVSFSQERRASRAVGLLRKKLQVKARVLRDGAWRSVQAKDLVPGDVIRVRPGDFVPADAKVVTGELEVDQSMLTGESLTTERNTDDVLFSGSVIRRGEASAVVILTGVRTYFGRTAELVQIARPKLHIEAVVTQVVRWLLVIVVVLLGVTLAASALRGVPLLQTLPLALVLLMSAIPVALPVLFTVTMAVGSMQLARNGALVTRLSATEDAASMDVLCVDKTGTITMNKLTVAQVLPVGGFTEQEVVRHGALASQEANQDPIDLAFIEAAKRAGALDDSFVTKSFAPFDASTRRTEAVVERDGTEFRVMKGAVRVVAQACGMAQEAIGELEARTSEIAQKGHRVLAVARSDGNNQPQLVGLVTLYDALRPDSRQLVEELQGLGVSVKMLTGDALPIAREVAGAVGIGGKISRVSDLDQLAKVDQIRAGQLAETSDGFAEIYPEGKYTVVKSLQQSGHVVGMTGDGVNDAPALRQAEVGIAVSSAVDVAKGAASVVLTDEGMSSIVNLVKNGRMIYQRILTWIINKISRTIFKAGFVVVAYLVTGKYVISAFGMVLVVFMTDFGKISLSTDNVRWSKEPERWDVRSLAKVAVILGLLMIPEALGLLFIGMRAFHLGANDLVLQTFSFEILFYFAIFSLFAVRERGRFWHSMPSKMLLAVLAAEGIITAIVATVGVPGLSPVSLGQTLCAIAYSFVFALVVNDWVKHELVRRLGLRW